MSSLLFHCERCKCRSLEEAEMLFCSDFVLPMVSMSLDVGIAFRWARPTLPHQLSPLKREEASYAGGNSTSRLIGIQSVLMGLSTPLGARHTRQITFANESDVSGWFGWFLGQEQGVRAPLKAPKYQGGFEQALVGIQLSLTRNNRRWRWCLDVTGRQHQFALASPLLRTSGLFYRRQISRVHRCRNWSLTRFP